MDLTLYQSKDLGETWDKVRILNQGVSGYSALGKLDGKLVVLYETSKDEKIIMESDTFKFLKTEIDIL